jgi:hypothetical protein
MRVNCPAERISLANLSFFEDNRDREKRNVHSVLKPMKKDKQQAFEKAHAEYEEWEDSLEGVAYWLGDLPVPEAVESVIIKTVHKLPSQIREFVYYECRFISLDLDARQTSYLQKLKQPWLLTVGQDQPDENAIAYEIAYAWLGHQSGPGLGACREMQPEEEAACALIRKWGFSGFGTKIRRQKQQLIRRTVRQRRHVHKHLVQKEHTLSYKKNALPASYITGSHSCR